ncbi:MAG: hypothetical protein ACAI34_05535 [Verrucomicrobium sp.]|nr:hypothetical protein [Verrucomicrobium sp.]
MKIRILPLLLATAVACLLPSCADLPYNTKPTASDMDRFYKRAEERANEQIAILDQQKAQGKMTQEQYDVRVTAAKNRIGQNANEMAWARHELADSQKRSLGIPTGDTTQDVTVPSSAGSESFYKPYGQVGSGFGTYSNPSGTPIGTMWHGYTPGGMASQAANR